MCSKAEANGSLKYWCVDELVVVGEVALEQVVHLFDDLGEKGLLLFLQGALPASVIGSSLGGSPSHRRRSATDQMKEERSGSFIASS